MAKGKRRTKHDPEYIDPAKVKQDMKDVVTRILEMQTRMEELERMVANGEIPEGQKIEAWGMPTWRECRDNIDAVATAMLRTVGNAKRSITPDAVPE